MNTRRLTDKECKTKIGLFLAELPDEVLKKLTVSPFNAFMANPIVWELCHRPDYLESIFKTLSLMDDKLSYFLNPINFDRLYSTYLFSQLNKLHTQLLNTHKIKMYFRRLDRFQASMMNIYIMTEKFLYQHALSYFQSLGSTTPYIDACVCITNMRGPWADDLTPEEYTEALTDVIANEHIQLKGEINNFSMAIFIREYLTEDDAKWDFIKKLLPDKSHENVWYFLAGVWGEKKEISSLKKLLSFAMDHFDDADGRYKLMFIARLFIECGKQESLNFSDQHYAKLVELSEKHLLKQPIQKIEQDVLQLMHESFPQHANFYHQEWKTHQKITRFLKTLAEVLAYTPASTPVNDKNTSSVASKLVQFGGRYAEDDSGIKKRTENMQNNTVESFRFKK